MTHFPMLKLFKILGLTLARSTGGNYRVDIGYNEYRAYGHGQDHNSEGCGPHHYCIEPGVLEHYIYAD
jgi:hypothetical protein